MIILGVYKYSVFRREFKSGKDVGTLKAAQWPLIMNLLLSLSDSVSVFLPSFREEETAMVVLAIQHSACFLLSPGQGSKCFHLCKFLILIHC